ncbi:ribosomal protein L13e [Gonapodya prolifera JEL478]|uniref:60S ribosomal protein L13 n=1 Tax=Gonapodya prolifera (strain JEL478) TaxID=1344416 RepID=A0A139ABR8_GONPJ|nr:ribosomal protein L13e [Gonapodya prolifera JEL478]|eukprot:KXS14197.1 ribosomal protein L13e [Gonapodya prolifera JEL478]
MGFRHNNQLPGNHFRKDWQRRVKTWFDQPARKLRRRQARVAKAAAIAPRPVDGLIRPAVRGQTFKYNTKLRAGRGFTLDELKAAGIRRKEALSIGISVDHRRKNRSEEGLALNVERLQAYKTRLVVFPRKAKKPKAGDADAAAVAAATQLTTPILPVTNDKTQTEAPRAVVQDKLPAFFRLRKTWSDTRLSGKREKAEKK